MFTSRRITTTGGDKFRDEFSLEFDGSDEYIQAPKPVDTAIATYVFWCKASTTGPNFGIFGHGGINTGAFHFNYSLSRPLTYLRSNLFHYWEDTPAQDDGKWHHWAVLVDPDDLSNWKCYVDGKPLASGGTTSGGGEGLANAYSDLRIGSDGGTSYGQCSMSEFVVYDVLLSASQVKTLYNGREPYNHNEGILTGNLKAWYRMGDGTFDQKSQTDAEGGIVCDMTNATLGADVFGGKGDFSDPSYWTITTGHSIVESGVAKWLGNGSYAEVKKNSILTSGQVYRIDFDVNSHDGIEGANGFALNFADPYIGVQTGSQTGHITAYFKAANTNFRLYTSTNYDVVAEIDNLVVRPVNGNAGAMDNFDTAGTSFKGDAP